MPIKIEGLCGIVVKNDVLYVLLPNAEKEEYSTVNKDKKLHPHFSAILLDFNKLDDESKQKFSAADVVNKTYIEQEGSVTKPFGRVVPNHEEVRFTFANGSNNLQVGTVYESFIEMKKVNLDDPAKLNTGLLNVLLPESKTTYDVDLICRAVIDKGELRSMEPMGDKYSFSEPTHYINPTEFHYVLHVDVTVVNVQVGDKIYSFQEGTNPIVGVLNLPPEERERHNDKDIDYDFELVYKLAPNATIKSLPQFHKTLPMKPAICPVAWFETQE